MPFEALSRQYIFRSCGKSGGKTNKHGPEQGYSPVNRRWKSLPKLYLIFVSQFFHVLSFDTDVILVKSLLKQKLKMPALTFQCKNPLELKIFLWLKHTSPTFTWVYKLKNL
ncbi:hypothetical protein CHS0354_039745 [Potamilus streckersoni]|uniref:Uncharacterized protein n=1 Tax=Potamilus streckersoni TaxID=2493646 RepID=A0AAE0RMT2_9BIVA|nr:hypothetical protein CHS0354_039745 [Potamilus streckersoni]